MKNKNAQVWIETVLYTVIGLALIGLVLAFITPKINEARDRIVVEQAIESLNGLDEKLNIGSGNVRNAEFVIKRGELLINSSGDSLILSINDLSKPYSEPNVSIPYGRIDLISRVGQKQSSIKMTLNYNNRFNITYNGKDEDKKFTISSTPYQFVISNKGAENGVYWIDIDELSGR